MFELKVEKNQDGWRAIWNLNVPNPVKTFPMACMQQHPSHKDESS